MSDNSPPVEESKRTKDETIIDAEVIESPEPAAEKPVEKSAEVSAVPVADASVAAPPAQQVVYVTAPTPPRKRGNRGLGSLLALLAGVVFTALLALATVLIGVLAGGRITVGFLTDVRFYIPVLFFVVGFVLLVFILNRAGWGAYVIGSLLLAVFVYFGTVGAGLLGQGVISRTPAEAAVMYGLALRDPFVIVSALLAREVSIWMGAAIASRGRRLKVRNAEARAAFDRELAEKKAEHERGSAAPAAAE